MEYLRRLERSDAIFARAIDAKKYSLMDRTSGVLRASSTHSGI